MHPAHQGIPPGVLERLKQATSLFPPCTHGGPSITAQPWLHQPGCCSTLVLMGQVSREAKPCLVLDLRAFCSSFMVLVAICSWGYVTRHSPSCSQSPHPKPEPTNKGATAATALLPKQSPFNLPVPHVHHLDLLLQRRIYQSPQFLFAFFRVSNTVRSP